MKIVIPMAGMGKRLRPFTLTTPKPLLKIAGKSIVQRLVEKLMIVTKEKITDVAFIIGDFPEDVNKSLYDLGDNLGFKTHIFVQDVALGTAHALSFANDLFDGSNVIVAFADTLFNADFVLDSTKDVIIWTKRVNNPQSYGVVVKNGDLITAFAEKPKQFVSDEAIIGIYYFKDSILLKNKLDNIIDNDLKVNGEYQLTDALQMLLDDGLNFYTENVVDWMDCGNKQVLLETAFKVLAEEDIKQKSLKIDDSVVVPPVFIGENVVLNRCVIGPNVSIEANSNLSNVVIDNSLVFENVSISNSVISDSIIGNSTVINNTKNNYALGDYNTI